MHRNGVVLRIWGTLVLVGTFVAMAAGATESAALPELGVRTENGAPVNSKDVYVPGELTVVDGEFPLRSNLEIRGRGNSTWHQPKKPYRLKFEAAVPLLGLPADQDWVLLAGYSDKTLMRNFLAFGLGRRLALAYTPRARFAELRLNDSFLGTYLVTEQLAVAPHRVNITPLKKKDVAGPALTGGYLLEICERMDEEFTFRTARKLPFSVKSPGRPNPEQLAYIKAYIQEAEDVLFGERFADPELGYAKYFDLPSLVDWYLVNELFRNQDAAGYSSIFLHKDRGGKLTMGPLWDFDIAAGNVDYDENYLPEGWWIRKSSLWYGRLFEDPAFAARVRARWQELRAGPVSELFPTIYRTAARLQYAQARNFAAWPILGKRVWPNYYVGVSYEDEVRYLYDWLETRVRWMDGEI